MRNLLTIHFNAYILLQFFLCLSVLVASFQTPSCKNYCKNVPHRSFSWQTRLNPKFTGASRWRDVASTIISHEQTQSNRVCCFQTLDAVFPKDLFSNYSEITTAVFVPCGGCKKYPRTSIKCCYFSIFLSCGAIGFNTCNREQIFAQAGARRLRYVASAIISHQTESAGFKLWMLYFERISFQIIRCKKPQIHTKESVQTKASKPISFTFP